MQTKMSSVIDGICQAQCLAVAVLAASCSRSGSRQWGKLVSVSISIGLD